MSMANRSARGYFFSLARRERFRIPQLGGADLLADGDQFPHQVTQTAIPSDLRLGAFRQSDRLNSCQVKKENLTKTWSDFHSDSDVVRPRLGAALALRL
jgi:hypothetical protein